MRENVNVWFNWKRYSRDVKWVVAKRVEDDWSTREDPDEVLVHAGDPLEWYVRSQRDAYDPYQEASGLFRELTTFEPTRKDFQDFVSKYGPLTLGWLFVPECLGRKLPRPPKGLSLAIWNSGERKSLPREVLDLVIKWHQAGAVQGDTLAFWTEFLREIKSFVSVWDAICQRDKTTLDRLVIRENKKDHICVSLLDEFGKAVYGPHRFIGWDSSELTSARAAEDCLATILSSRINTGVGLSMYGPESRNRGQLAMVPRTLYDAIWLQFVLAVNGSKKYGACEVCGRPFEISPQVARTNRKLCSAACKAKAHRRRHEQALSLASQGRTAKQIAKQVGSQLTTVQNWLKEAKGGK